MNRRLRQLVVLATGRSETLNGYTAGISIIALSIIASTVPPSLFPPVPFLQLLLSNYPFLVLAAISGGCILLARTTISFSAGSIHHLMLFSLLALALSVPAYIAGILAGSMYNAAEVYSLFNPSVLLSISLVLTSAFVVTHAARLTFMKRAMLADSSPAENRV